MKIIKLAKKPGVKEVTFYGFTADNCKREKSQRLAFSKACVDAVNIISNESAEILVVGNQNLEMFSHELSKYTIRTSLNGAVIKVNFLINYGWE